MAPHGRVSNIAAKKPRGRRRARENNVDAAIVAACQARLANTAWDIGFNGDHVANLEIGHGMVSGDDYTSGFVAKDVVGFDVRRTDCTGMPEMDLSVGAAFVSCYIENGLLHMPLVDEGY